jgi:hypothetical protein
VAPINPANLLLRCFAAGSFSAARLFGSSPNRSPSAAITPACWFAILIQGLACGAPRLLALIRGALASEDAQKAQGESPRFRVRETADWREHAAKHMLAWSFSGFDPKLTRVTSRVGPQPRGLSLLMTKYLCGSECLEFNQAYRPATVAADYPCLTDCTSGKACRHHRRSRRVDR